MAEGLSVSRLINVTVTLEPAGALVPNFQTCLLLGTSDVIDVTTRMREYNSLTEVAADFGTDAEEYLAARLWFGQSPAPESLFIGRWANAATAGQLYCGPLAAADQLVAAWTPINNGGFAVTIDGVGPQQVGNLDFSAAANLNQVASIIEAGIPGGTATCVYDATYHRFVITSATTGAASSISFLAAPGAGTDISAKMAGLETSSGAYVADGVDAQGALDTVVIFDVMFGSQWYGLVVPSAVDADHLEIAQYVEGTDNHAAHFYGVTTADGGTIIAGDTNNVAAELAAINGLNHTAVTYSTSSPYAVMSMLARILTTNWEGNNTTITLMYKQEPLVEAETLTATQATAVDDKNCNVFVGYNNDTAIIQYGKSSSGNFVDSVIGCDWLRAAIQTNVYNLLYTSTTKVAQTDAGMNQIATAIAQVLQQAVANGLVAPGRWNGGGFGQLKQGDYLDTGYYIYAPPVAQQLEADRAARKSVPFQVAAKLAGAVHTVDVAVTVES